LEQCENDIIISANIVTFGIIMRINLNILLIFMNFKFSKYDCNSATNP